MTNKKKNTLLDFLPRGSYNQIYTEINGKVTKRTIQRIIAAEKLNDEYGIMEIALRMASENRKMITKQKRTITLLKQTSSTTKSK